MGASQTIFSVSPTQVLSIDLRCRQKKGLGVVLPPCIDPEEICEEDEDTVKELNYCKILNSILPEQIRVLAWSPVQSDFSARFSCLERTYRYYFPLADLDLDVRPTTSTSRMIYLMSGFLTIRTSLSLPLSILQRMRQGAQFLLGTHDFRNFCKLDSNGENCTMRRVIEARIESASHLNPALPVDGDSYSLCVLIIKGQSFVWHQIRCIVSILILIGKGLEDPEIVSRLLNLNVQPKYVHCPFPIISCYAKTLLVLDILLYNFRAVSF